MGPSTVELKIHFFSRRVKEALSYNSSLLEFCFVCSVVNVSSLCCVGVKPFGIHITTYHILLKLIFPNN